MRTRSSANVRVSVSSTDLLAAMLSADLRSSAGGWKGPNEGDLEDLAVVPDASSTMKKFDLADLDEDHDDGSSGSGAGR